MKRRILAFFLALVLVGTMFPTQAWAVPAPTVACSSGQAVPGETVLAELTAENLPPVGSLSVELFYDSTALEVAYTQQGGMLDSADQVSVNDQTPGCLRLKAISLAGISGSGTLLQVTFRVRENCPAGNYTLSTAVGEVLGTDLAPVTVQGRNGRVRVEAGAERPDTFGIYTVYDRTPLEKGEVLAVQVWQRDGRPFSSAEFSLLYDRDHFHVVSAALGETLLREGAVHSINQATEGVVRVAYASDTPVSGSLLLTVQLQVTADIDAVSVLEARAENVWQEPGRPYLPGKVQDTVTLRQKEEVALSKLSLETERLVVEQEAGAMLTLEKGSQLAAANFMLTYDPTVLSCVAVSAAPEVKAHGGMVMINENYKQGKIRFTYLNESAWSEGNLPLLRITWKPLRSPQEHYQVTPSGEGVVDLGQKPVHLEYMTDSDCIYEKEVVPPACTEEGYTVYRCACGVQLREDIQSPQGHIYSKDPFSCDRCGEERRVKSITVDAMPEKTVYLQEAETLDLRGGALRVVMEDGEELRLPMQEAEVLGFDNCRPGEKTLTLRLRGAETTLVVEVIPNFQLPLYLDVASENSEAMLRWSGPEGADRYEVYCAVNGGKMQRIGETVQRWMRTQIQAGSRYVYTVYGLLNQWPEGKYSSNQVSCIGKCIAPKLQVHLDKEGKSVLEWSRVTGAVSYTVLVSTDGIHFTELTTVQETSLNHKEAQYGQEYRYQVKANGSAPEAVSDPSNTVQIMPVKPLSAPKLQAYLDKEGKPVLEWNKVPSAMSYTVLVSTDGIHFTELTTVQETSLNHKEAQYGQTYRYQVKANGSAPEAVSDPSNTVQIMPVKPLSVPKLQAYLDKEGKPVLEWSRVPGAVSYTVMVSTNGSHFTELATVQETSLNHKEAQYGQAYRYQVKANGSAPEAVSDPSNTVQIMPVKHLPAPVLQAHLDKEGKPILEWSRVPSAMSYTVLVSTDGSYFTELATVQETSLNHKEAQYGQEYRYQVKANGSAPEAVSDPSNTVQIMPVKHLPAPALQAHLDKEGKPVLEWSKVSGAVSYTVLVSTDGSYFTELATVQETSLKHKEAQYGQEYRYQVKANGSAPEAVSDPSNTVQIMPVKPLSAPKLQAHLDKEGKPILEWSRVPGAVSYTVLVSTDGIHFTELATVQETSLNHKEAQYGQEYRYQVKANGSAPEAVSDPSNTVQIMPVEPLSAPVLQAHLDKEGKPALEWSKVSGAVSYTVLVSTDGSHFTELATVQETSLNHKEAQYGQEYRYQVKANGSAPEAVSDPSNTVQIMPVEPLSAPVLQAHLDKEGRPVLEWSKVSGAVSYTVLVSTDGSHFTELATVQETSLKHKEAQYGQAYRYQVKANGSIPESGSDPSNIVSITLIEPKPLPNAEAYRKDTTGKPYIWWTEIPGATGYEVWFSEDNGVFSHLYTAKGTHLSHGSAKPGVKYRYMVRAFMGQEPGDFGAEAEVVCACAMPKVTLSHRTDGKPVLQWQKISGATGYEIYRSVNGSDFYSWTNAHGTQLTHGSAKAGDTYAYRVRALCQNPQGNSAFSNSVSGMVEEIQLGVPSLSISNKSSTGKPYLKWSRVDGAAKYEVWRATSKTGTYNRLFTTSGTSLTNGSAKAGKTYYYKVRAVDADGMAGAFSDVKLRTCDCARPDVKLTTRSGHPRLTWQKVSGAVKYEVYCSINGGSFRRLLTVKGTSLTHSSAKKGNTYRYRVRAICSRSAGNSAWSYYDTIKVK